MIDSTTCSKSQTAQGLPSDTSLVYNGSGSPGDAPVGGLAQEGGGRARKPQGAFLSPRSQYRNKTFQEAEQQEPQQNSLTTQSAAGSQ